MSPPLISVFLIIRLYVADNLNHFNYVERDTGIDEVAFINLFSLMKLTIRRGEKLAVETLS